MITISLDEQGNFEKEALHSNGNPSRDHHVVRPVKERVTATLAEFLQHGTYKEQALCNDAAEELPVRKGDQRLRRFMFYSGGYTGFTLIQ